VAKYISLLFVLTFGVVSIIGSGGGGGSGHGDADTPSGFTAGMLNATYYVTYDGDPDGTTVLGTTQETIVFSGTGPYVATVTAEYFNESGVSQGTETFQANIVLNQDGTLTATVTGEAGETILTLLAETATYLQVRGVDTETWEDFWYFAPPAGWLTPSSGFTAVMLNAGPTYYVTYDGDPDGTTVLGTTQETIVFSGTGPYVATVTTEYFDASGVSQGQEMFDVNVILNADGTLTAQSAGEPEATIITLTGETATYLLVNGVASATETWDDTWYLAPPAGWL